MKVDIDPINSGKVLKLMVNHLTPGKAGKKEEVKEEPAKRLTPEDLKDIVKKELPGFDFKDMVDDLKKIAKASEVFNKKVSISFNKDLNRIIFTIIDKSSNKVIREIPCNELQNLALHLKEAIGLLYDKIA